MACDLAVTSDMAIFGQAGPKHGSAPAGGSTDFLPWFLSMEDAMYNCISCETWSAYKMKAKGLVSKTAPVLKKDGAFVRNPLVHTEQYVLDGEIVYGEPKVGADLAAAKTLVKECSTDLSLLDHAVQDLVWRFANLFPGSLQTSIDLIRVKKKFFWDQSKIMNRHWLSVNMMTEAYLGFYAFATRKQTGEDVIDFLKFRQLIAAGAVMDDAAFEAVLPEPKE